MKNKSLKITVPAVMSALAVVLMYLSSLLPTGRLGFLGMASLLGISVVIESGVASAIGFYIVSTALGFLLVPAKSVVLIYALFFGYYAIIKCVAERGNRKLGWILKFAVMNAALTVMIFGLKEIFYDISGLNYALPVVYIIINAAFTAYDIGLTGVIGIYMAKIHRKIRR